MSRPVQPIQIGRHSIGRGHPCYVIAEIGVNHDGRLDRALELVDAAKTANANAVKFQWFTTSELVTAAGPTAPYQQDRTGHRSQYAMLTQLELQANDFAILRERTRELDLHFLCTPFSEADLHALRSLQPSAIKLASSDLNNVILQRAAAGSGFPLIISTGASTEGEIERAAERLRRWNVTQGLIFLHCVSAYPTPWKAANLRAIQTLSRLTGCITGFSDHTASTSTGALAAAAGACVLEKHLTYDRHASGPDHALSLEPKELADYIAKVREAEQALGNGRLGCQMIEAEVRQVARRSLVARRPIAADERVTAEMLTVKRPGGGIDPESVDDVVGRRSLVAVGADEPLRWENLE